MSEQGNADRPSRSSGIGSAVLADRADRPLSARPRAARWLLVGLAGLALGAGACSETGRPRGSSESASDGDAGLGVGAPDASAPADGGLLIRGPRRPSRRYFVASIGDRCELYWEQGEQRSDPEPIPCPRDMSSGERIRLAGQVCLLEGHNRAQGEPVRCPAKLVALELRDRREASDATSHPDASGTP